MVGPRRTSRKTGIKKEDIKKEDIKIETDALEEPDAWKGVPSTEAKPKREQSTSDRSDSDHKLQEIPDDETILRNIDRKNLATDDKVKIEKELQLDDNILRDRYTSAEAFDPIKVELDQDIQGVLVSRAYISHYFGGNRQLVHPPVSKEKYDNPGAGLNDFMFLDLENHPSAPTRPGQHGIWHENAVCEYRDLTIDPAVADFMEIKLLKETRKPSTTAPVNTSGIYRVHVGGYAGTNKRKWRYAGQYELPVAVPLTPEELNDHPEKFISGWVNWFQKKSWSLDIRFRVKYRRIYGREPSEEEETHLLALVKAKLVSASDWDVSADWIREDLNSGVERLDVHVMKCVDYDADYQRKIAVGMENHIKNPPPPEDETRTPKAAATGVKGRKRAPLTPAKSKSSKKRRIITPSDDEEEEAYIPKSRGTKSRPKST
ncbi:unnamed protein product [Peniophora sp. CBMAI 1063]|nr:unnamed protein product [Peniophora sp. CBMAI 1063]